MQCLSSGKQRINFQPTVLLYHLFQFQDSHKGLIALKELYLSISVNNYNTTNVKNMHLEGLAESGAWLCPVVFMVLFWQ